MSVSLALALLACALVYRRMARYRALLETSEAMPFECDPVEKSAPYMSPRLAQLLGCSPRDLASVAFLRSRVHPDDLSHLSGTMYAYARGGHTASTPFEFRLLGRADQPIHIRVFLSQRAFDGTRVRGVMLDVTRWKALEAEAQHALRVEAIAQLAGTMAHEINTPIQYVDDSLHYVKETVAELLARVPMTPELAALPKAIGDALAGTARVAAIVKSVGAVGQEASRERVPIDVVATIDRAIADSHEACARFADVVRACEAVPSIDGMPRELDQVIRDLVGHAAQAIASTGRRGTITVATRASSEEVMVSVSDSAGGLTDDARAQMFDPFYASPASRGLAVARAVVEERLGGSLTLDSRAGIGTTFHLRFPIRRANHQELAA